MWFDVLVAIAAIAGGGIAAVTGFGIGSLLTPALALQVEASLAVAAVSVPHAVGTALRFWMLRARIDRRVLWSFGLTSAAGGLAGAVLHRWATSRWLFLIFGFLLLFAGAGELTGAARRMQFRGRAAWMAGAFSGLLGGLVGNQGGIRAAALLGFELSKHSFVATATAIGLFVDAARIPVYLGMQHEEIAAIGRWVMLATAGVVIGTLLGHSLLTRVPESRFRHVVAAILLALGAAMLHRARQAA